MGIIAHRGYLKHSPIHRLEFDEMYTGTAVNYFDLMEDHLLAWDDVAYESVRNNRRSSKKKLLELNT